MARLVDQAVTRLMWVPTISNPAAATTTELNAGTDLTAVMTTAYDFGADPSDKVSEAAVSDTAKTEAPTMVNYHLSVVAFRQYTAGTPAANDPLTIWAGNYELGYFVRRIGKASTAAWASGDKYDIGLFVMDVPSLDGGTAAGYLKLTVSGLMQGYYKINAAVA